MLNDLRYVSLNSSTGLLSWMICMYHPAINWRLWRKIAKGSAAFASMIGGACTSYGPQGAQKMLRLWITT